MRKALWVWGFVCLFSGNAHYFEGSKTVDLTVSGQGLTRLEFEGDKIVDLFVYPGNYQRLINLHKSGNLFISPGEGTFYLTLLSASGLKQDLKVTYSLEVPSNPITFKTKPQPLQEKERAPQVDLTQTLKIFLEGKELPEGFGPMAYKEEGRRGLSKALFYWTRGCYGKGPYKVYKATLQNTSAETLLLTTSLFKGFERVAVPKTLLKPQEEITFFYLKEEGILHTKGRKAMKV